MIRATLDLGSNSFHLLIVGQDNSDILRLHHKTHLAEGLQTTNRIGKQAQVRALACLAHYRQCLVEHRVTRLCIVATAAVRVAANGNAFLCSVQQVFGVPVMLLTGNEEARLTYLGAHRHKRGTHPDWVIDIGGASSEVAFGGSGIMQEAVSMPFGVVTLGERYFTAQCVSKYTYKQAKVEITPLVQKALQAVAHHNAQKALGTSGAIGCLPALGAHFGIVIDTHITLMHLDALITAWHDQPLHDVSLADMPSHLNYLLLAGIMLLDVIMHTLILTKITPCATALCDGVLMDTALHPFDSNH